MKQSNPHISDIKLLLNVKRFIIYSGWIFAVLMFIVAYLEHSSRNQTEQKNDTLRNVVSVQLPNLYKQGKAIIDSSKKRERNDSLFATKKLLKHDTAKVVLIADTVQKNLKILLSKDYDAVILKKNDTIKQIKKLYLASVNEVSHLKTFNRNVVFSGLNSKNKPIIQDTTNASIYVVPFKKSSNKTIFSPQKNYLRVYNQIPTGTINGMPYFDYEQTNDELNQLNFQFRSSYNFKSKTPQIGLGVELKLNRFGVSVACFSAPFSNSKTPVFSVGIREDFYNIKFK